MEYRIKRICDIFIQIIKSIEIEIEQWTMNNEQWIITSSRLFNDILQDLTFKTACSISQDNFDDISAARHVMLLLRM